MTELHELLEELQNSSPVKYKGQEYCNIIEEIDRRLKVLDEIYLCLTNKNIITSGDIDKVVRLLFVLRPKS